MSDKAGGLCPCANGSMEPCAHTCPCASEVQSGVCYRCRTSEEYARIAQPSREGGEPVMWRYPSVNGEWHTSETEPGVLAQEPLYAAAAPKPKG